jgi:hypothetical protein
MEALDETSRFIMNYFIGSIYNFVVPRFQPGK